MLVAVVGIGFTAVCAVIGYFGKRAIERSDAFRGEMTDGINELRIDVAVLFARNGLQPATRTEREKVRREVNASL